MQIRSGEFQIGIWCKGELVRTHGLAAARDPLSRTRPLDLNEWEWLDEVDGSRGQPPRPRSPASNVVTDAEYAKYMCDGAASDHPSVHAWKLSHPEWSGPRVAFAQPMSASSRDDMMLHDDRLKTVYTDDTQLIRDFAYHYRKEHGLDLRTP